MVTKEISLPDSIGGGLDVVYDPNNQVMYVLGNDNEKIAIIDTTTDSYVDTIDSNVIDWENPARIRYDSSNGRLYIVDHDDGYIYTLEPEDPKNLEFDPVLYNAQVSGYCYGSNLKNGCSCDSDSDCASGDCETDVMLPYCKQSDCSEDSDKPDGCSCSTDSDCDNGNCVSGTCYSASLPQATDIKGYYDLSTGLDYTTDEAEENWPDLEDVDCDNPADILILPDQTALVSCYGSFDGDNNQDDDSLMRLMWGPDGLAGNGDSMAATTSHNYCDKPSKMAVDPDDDARYAFIICFGENKLLVYDFEMNQVAKRLNLPNNPIDILATSDYVYVSGSTSNTIARFSIPDFVPTLIEE